MLSGKTRPGDLPRPSTLKSLAASQHACPACPRLPACLPSSCEVPRPTCSLHVLLELVRSPRQEPTHNTWACSCAQRWAASCAQEVALGSGRSERFPWNEAEGCLLSAACKASPGACGREASGPQEVCPASTGLVEDEVLGRGRH